MADEQRSAKEFGAAAAAAGPHSQHCRGSAQIPHPSALYDSVSHLPLSPPPPPPLSFSFQRLVSKAAISRQTPSPAEQCLPPGTALSSAARATPREQELSLLHGKPCAARFNTASWFQRPQHPANSSFACAAGELRKACNLVLGGERARSVRRVCCPHALFQKLCATLTAVCRWKPRCSPSMPVSSTGRREAAASPRCSGAYSLVYACLLRAQQGRKRGRR